MALRHRLFLLAICHSLLSLLYVAGEGVIDGVDAIDAPSSAAEKEQEIIDDAPITSDGAMTVSDEAETTLRIAAESSEAVEAIVTETERVEVTIDESTQTTDIAAPTTNDRNYAGEYIPLTYRIHERQTECIYDLLIKDDQVTYSAYVIESLNNGPLAIDVKFEGPLLPPSYPINELGRSLQNSVDEGWHKYKDADLGVRHDKRIGIINQDIRVDWTHAGENEDAIAMRNKIDAERREAIANHHESLKKPGGVESAEGRLKSNVFRTVTMSNINPYEVLNVIKAPGWYRLCVSADMHELLVNMEIRSGNAMGGVNSNTGHVYTYAERERLDAEHLMDEEIARHETESQQLDYNTYGSLDEELKKAIENQVKEHDLHQTKAQISRLTSLVAEIRRSIDHHNDRINNHKATARRNHNGMVFSGVVETILYVILAGIQAYTVRRWLLGPALLGEKIEVSLDTWSKYN